jgi:hypothetical protein
MTITITPGTTVNSNSLITPDLLNAGFTPSAQVNGQVVAADIADGAVQARHLANGLIAAMPAVTPTASSYLLVESTGPTLGRATLQQVAEAMPSEAVLQKAFDGATSVPTAAGTDELLLYRSTQPAGSRLYRVAVSNFALADVVTGGTYRVGQITIDSKGRVLNVDPDGGYYKSPETAIPSPLTAASFSHGLATQPAFADVWLKCVNAENGYGVGEVVHASAWIALVSGYAVPALVARPTNTVISVFNYASAAANLRTVRVSDGALVTPTPANWVFWVTARL